MSYKTHSVLYNLDMKLGKNELVLFLIFCLALFLRFYRMDDLAVFLADQASDSTAGFNMTKGKLTLLGPITSVGGFYNGPIVYYLMLPFYFVFKSEPIAGTFFQSILQIATIPLIFLLGKKIKNELVGLVAAFLFSVSPLMIDYSRAAFNSYPAIFFSTLIIYLFLKTIDKLSIKLVIVLGIAIGFILQMHYLTLSFIVLAVLYPLFFEKKLITSRYYMPLLVGVTIGLSPFLLFELRHKFLNTHLFIDYIFSAKNSVRSPIFALQIWPKVAGQLLFGENRIVGALGFITTVAMTTYLYVKNEINKKHLTVFIFFWVVVIMISLSYGRALHDHYIISFHTSFIILFALVIYYLANKKSAAIVPFCLIIFLINTTRWNLDKIKHPLQDGLSIVDFKKTAQIIQNDKKNRYNVGMHAQGDNRAMPLRYMLGILGESPFDYTDYRGADNLYFIVRKNEPLTSLQMWEYTSFGQSKEREKWEVNDQYFLYKLTKK